jgi:hypothetical protein
MRFTVDNEADAVPAEGLGVVSRVLGAEQRLHAKRWRGDEPARTMK